MHVIRLDNDALSYHCAEAYTLIIDTLEIIANKYGVTQFEVAEAYVTADMESILLRSSSYQELTTVEQLDLIDDLTERIGDALADFNDQHFLVELGIDYNTKTLSFVTRAHSLTKEQYNTLMLDETFE